MEDRRTDDAGDDRAARLKAALKANMGRRKAQARDAAPNHSGRRRDEEASDG